MRDIQTVLKEYWGYDDFRPLQEDIIRSIIEGKDTLALLPTGGGKSICFQVPGLAMDGVCVVISPLIALMKDQVNGLNKRGVKAMALISGMRESEVDTILDNCIYGGTKFLYLSPERLKSDLVQARLKKMKINLFAIDEAHCISQWGYDFRPSYLEIASLREWCPEVPVMALTATATPEVVEDIQVQLQFKEKHCIQKSFARDNLAYMAFEEEDKLNKLFLMLRKNPGSVIIYMRSRKNCEKLSDRLNAEGFSATFYHAGLNLEVRQSRQQSWTKAEKRVMVATNAFGMGIDKPDVRLVVHLDIPESPEAYFQEAGRGGRDGKKAFAVMFFNKNDIENLKKRHQQQFPPIKQVKRAYTALGNYLQLAAGSGEGESFEFSLDELASRFNLDAYELQQCFKILELSQLMSFEEDSFLASRVKMICEKSDLYHYELQNPRDAKLTRTLLRSHIGVFDTYVKINENSLAKRLNESYDFVRKSLERLDKLNIVSYVPQSAKPKVTFLRARLRENDLKIPKLAYRFRKEMMKKKLDSMLAFVSAKDICRTRFLLDYFGEKESLDCGICDVCVKKKNAQSSYKIRREISLALQEPGDIDKLRLNLDVDDEQLLSCLRHMLDDGTLIKKDKTFFLNIK